MLSIAFLKLPSKPPQNPINFMKENYNKSMQQIKFEHKGHKMSLVQKIKSIR